MCVRIGSMVICLLFKVNLVLACWRVRLLLRGNSALLLFRVCILVLVLNGLKINMVKGLSINMANGLHINIVHGLLLNMVNGLKIIMVNGLRINMVNGLHLSMVNGLQVIMVLGIIINKVLGLFLILGISSRLRLLTMVTLKSLAFDVPGA